MLVSIWDFKVWREAKVVASAESVRRRAIIKICRSTNAIIAKSIITLITRIGLSKVSL